MDYHKFYNLKMRYNPLALMRIYMQHHFKNVVFQRIQKGSTAGNQVKLSDVLANGKTESALIEALQKQFKGDTIKLKSYQ